MKPKIDIVAAQRFIYRGLDKLPERQMAMVPPIKNFGIALWGDSVLEDVEVPGLDNISVNGLHAQGALLPTTHTHLIMMLGGNDLEGSAVEAVFANIQRLLAGAEATGIKVTTMLIPPRFDIQDVEKLPALNKLLETVAAKSTLYDALVPEHFRGYWGLHPTADGVKAMNKALGKLVDQPLNKKQDGEQKHTNGRATAYRARGGRGGRGGGQGGRRPGGRGGGRGGRRMRQGWGQGFPMDQGRGWQYASHPYLHYGPPEYYY